jgi:cytochrome c oxidase cbb3-type subunit III
MRKILPLAVLLVAVQPQISAAEDPGEGKRLYQTYCTGCHGALGKGDGPAGKTLPVKPADHTNAKVMNRYADDYLFAVISKGGAEVGKSAAMPAWGSVLKEDKIKDVIAYLRTLADATRSSSRKSSP